MRRVGLLMVLVLAGGCTAVAESPSTPDPVEPTGISLPARPRDLRIDGVDPCSLLTEQQRAELGFEQRADPFADDSQLFRGLVPSCLLRGQSPRRTSVGVGVVTTVGIERFTAESLDAELRATIIRGFPALIAVPKSVSDYCNVEIDVASGQLIDVLYGDVGSAPIISQEELCGGATRVAEAVMANLLR